MFPHTSQFKSLQYSGIPHASWTLAAHKESFVHHPPEVAFLLRLQADLASWQAWLTAVLAGQLAGWQASLPAKQFGVGSWAAWLRLLSQVSTVQYCIRAK